MKRLADHFLKGCLVLTPIAVTVWTVWFVLVTVDRLLPLPIPGLGIVVAVAGITLMGAVAGNVVGQRMLSWIESLLRKLPVVRVLFTSMKDLMGAFVGDKRTFDKPAMVTLDEAGVVRVLGFVTCEHFDDPRLAGCVAVYLPQSYNFAGNVIVVPKSRVERIDADGAEFMAFVVSGGVSGMSAAKTYLDEVVLLRASAARGPSKAPSGPPASRR